MKVTIYDFDKGHLVGTFDCDNAHPYCTYSAKNIIPTDMFRMTKGNLEQYIRLCPGWGFEIDKSEDFK